MKTRMRTRWQVAGLVLAGLTALFAGLTMAGTEDRPVLKVTDVKGATLQVTDPKFGGSHTGDGFMTDWVSSSWFAWPVQLDDGRCMLIYLETIAELKRTGDAVVVHLTDKTEVAGKMTGQFIDSTWLEGSSAFGAVRMKLQDVQSVVVDLPSVSAYIARMLKEGLGRLSWEYAPKPPPNRVRVSLISGASVELDHLQTICSKTVTGTSYGIVTGRPIRTTSGFLSEEDFLPVVVGSQSVIKASLDKLKVAEFERKGDTLSVKMTAEDGSEVAGPLSGDVFGLWGIGDYGPVYIQPEKVRKIETLLRMTASESEELFRVRVAAARLRSGEATALRTVSQATNSGSAIVRRAAEEAFRKAKVVGGKSGDQ